MKTRWANWLTLPLQSTVRITSDRNHSKSNFKESTHESACFVQMNGRGIDAFLEERLNDIDELIQSELGFAPLNITEPFAAPEIHNVSFLLETEGDSVGFLSNNILGEYTCVS